MGPGARGGSGTTTHARTSGRSTKENLTRVRAETDGIVSVSTCEENGSRSTDPERISEEPWENIQDTETGTDPKFVNRMSTDDFSGIPEDAADGVSRYISTAGGLRVSPERLTESGS